MNGYTDALGSDSYNMKLSLERAANSRAYLLGQRIPQTRIFINGYGENNPVAINTDPDGKDSPEGRKYNRRVEIKFENIPEKLTILFDDPVPYSLRIK